MRRFSVCLVTTTALVLALASPSSAVDFKVLSKWRNCENQQAALSYRTTFLNPAGIYGSGGYMIKSQIRWEKYTPAGWRKLDANTIQTPWTNITNEQFDFPQSHGDRTNWGNWYSNRWRAHVIVKLIKNRPGPRDKRVETIERFFESTVFSPRGGCTVTGPGTG